MSKTKDWMVDEEQTVIPEMNKPYYEEVRRREDARQADGEGQTRPGKNG